jgi:hypothetical protein
LYCESTVEQLCTVTNIVFHGTDIRYHTLRHRRRSHESIVIVCRPPATQTRLASPQYDLSHSGKASPTISKPRAKTGHPLHWGLCEGGQAAHPHALEYPSTTYISLMIRYGLEYGWRLSAEPLQVRCYSFDSMLPTP